MSWLNSRLRGGRTIASLFHDNPIVRHETIAKLRSADTAWPHLAFIALAATLIVAVWPSDEFAPLVVAGYGRLLRALLICLLFVFTTLVIPVVTAPLIAGEKERGSYDLLLTTPLRPVQFVAGKLTVPMVFATIVFLSCAPFAAALVVTGGVSWSNFVGDYVLLFSFALLLSTCSLTCSALSSSARTALLMSLGVALAIAVPCGVLLLNRVNIGTSQPYHPQAFGILVPAAIATLAGGGMLLRARILRPPDSDVAASKPEEEPQKVPPFALAIDRRRFPDMLIVPPPRRAPIPLRVNPVYDRMVRTELYGRGPTMLRWLIQSSTLLSAVLMGWALLIRPDYYYVYFWFLLAFVSLVGGAIAGSCIASEFEQKTLQLLRTSTLSVRTFVVGKWLGTVRLTGALLGLVTVVQVGAPACLYWGPTTIGVLLSALLIVLVFTLFVCSLGCFLSALTRRSVRAQLACYALITLLFLGAAWVRPYTPRLNLQAPVGHGVVAFYAVDVLSPANMLPSLALLPRSFLPSVRPPQLAGGALGYVAAHLVLYGLASLVLLGSTAYLLRRAWNDD